MSDVETKILMSEYRTTFVQAFVDSGVVNVEQSMLLINKAQSIVDTFLTCTKCKQVLPDDSFYPQKTCIARRGRASVCKDCWKELHVKRKGFR